MQQSSLIKQISNSVRKINTISKKKFCSVQDELGWWLGVWAANTKSLKVYSLNSTEHFSTYLILLLNFTNITSTLTCIVYDSLGR
jgi:hypothetical protein